MSKKIIYLLVFAFTLGLCASCSDDDDDNTPDNTPDYAQEIAGTYDGKMNITVIEATASIDRDIILTRTEKNKIKFELNEFGFNGFNIGNIVVENVSVEKNGETIKINETTANVKLINEIGTVKITVGGTVNGDHLDITIAVKEVMQLGNIDVTFSGDKELDYAQKIAGTYDGEMTVTVLGIPSSIDRDIILARTEKNKIKFELNNFGFNEFNIGNIVVENVSVEKNGNAIKINETTANVPLIEEIGTVEITVGGTVNGDHLDITIAVKDVMELGDIGVTFSGDKGAK